MNAPEPAVDTRALTKRYGASILAVDQLALQVRRGEVYGFLGPNGAGKTTTLRMLLGLVTPSSGSATVLGRAPGDPDALRRVGSLVESPAFYPYLSGRDNLRLLARYSAVSDDGIQSALARVDLSARARDKFSTYSMGMKQRLAVAGALLKQPELLILDEPSNGLDPQGMVEMRDLLRSLAGEGRTVLVSSHLLGEVEHICDRVGVIQRGRLIAEGTIAEIRGGASGLILRATPSERAAELLRHSLGAEAVHELGEDRLQIAAEPARAGALNRLLVEAGVEVSELRVSERSLEDVFLQLTEQSHP